MNMNGDRKLLVNLEELERTFPPISPLPGTPQDREKQLFEAGKREVYLFLVRLYNETQRKGSG